MQNLLELKQILIIISFIVSPLILGKIVKLIFKYVRFIRYVAKESNGNPYTAKLLIEKSTEDWTKKIDELEYTVKLIIKRAGTWRRLSIVAIKQLYPKNNFSSSWLFKANSYTHDVWTELHENANRILSIMAENESNGAKTINSTATEIIKLDFTKNIYSN